MATQPKYHVGAGLTKEEYDRFTALRERGLSAHTLIVYGMNSVEGVDNKSALDNSND